MKKKSFIVSLKRKSIVLSGIISFFAVILGLVGAVFAAMGVCFVCTLPAIVFILGLFGLSISVLYDYNKVFIGVGAAFFILSIYLYRRKKCSDGVCTLG